MYPYLRKITFQNVFAKLLSYSLRETKLVDNDVKQTPALNILTEARRFIFCHVQRSYE